MTSITEIPASAAKAVDIVCTDIDDTLTEGGLLLPEAFLALWQLREAGIAVIPAGWCDCIVRQWPVEAVVGENGAFAWYRDGDRIRELTHPDVASPEHRRRLDDVKRAVLEQVPGVLNRVAGT